MTKGRGVNSKCSTVVRNGSDLGPRFSVQFRLISFILHVRLGPGPLRCLSLTRIPMWEPIHGPLLTNYSCSAEGAQKISLRLDDLVVPKLPACECE